MPSEPLETARLPVASRPMRLPWKVLLLMPMRTTPALALPEITFPAPALVPPMVTGPAPFQTRMPMLALGAARAPLASVPM